MQEIIRKESATAVAKHATDQRVVEYSESMQEAIRSAKAQAQELRKKLLSGAVMDESDLKAAAPSQSTVRVSEQGSTGSWVQGTKGEGDEVVRLQDGDPGPDNTTAWKTLGMPGDDEVLIPPQSSSERLKVRSPQPASLLPDKEG